MKNEYEIRDEKCYMKLSKGQECVIDIEDMEIVAKHKWCATMHSGSYYVKTSWYKGKGNSVEGIELQLFLLGRVVGKMVDHRDRDTLNNTRSNLRHVTRAENSLNSKKRKGSASSYIGVTLEPNKKWRARVVGAGPDENVGYFKNEHEAGIARAKVFVKHYGEEANLEQTKLSKESVGASS